MTTNRDAGDTLTVRRLIAAPREQVFAAWLDPASLAQWMRPGGDSSRATAEVDARVGGTFRIVMMHGVAEGGVDHWGEYVAIEPPSLLSFTWISVNTDRQPTLVTVEFLERGTGTELVLTHRRLPPNMIDAHRGGWTAIVRRLDATLTTGGREAE